MTASRTVLMVTLFVHEGREAEFDEFERQAVRIMARHGGRVERVIRPTAVLPAGPLPREIHVVTFPDLAAFDVYRTDAELLALAPVRAAAIARHRCDHRSRRHLMDRGSESSERPSRWERVTAPAISWIRASGFDRPAIVQIVKAAIAAVAAWELTLRWLGADTVPIYAALTALLTVGATVQQSVGSAVQRSLGAIAGVLVAAALTRWLGLTAGSLGLLLFVGLVVGRLLHLGPQGAMQVAVSALLVMSVGATREHYASERVEGTVAGALVGVLVNLAVAPPTSLATARAAVHKLAEDIADLFAEIGAGVASGWTLEKALLWRGRGRRLHDFAAAARDALDRAEESLRYNPRERRTREALGRYERALDALNRVLINARIVSRALREAAHEGHAQSLVPGLEETFQRAAALVRAYVSPHALAFARWPREREERGAARARPCSRKSRRNCD